MSERVKASDCKCNVKGCNEQAVAFWPCIDPDIRSFPWCRKHLDEELNRFLVEMHKEGLI